MIKFIKHFIALFFISIIFTILYFFIDSFYVDMRNDVKFTQKLLNTKEKPLLTYRFRTKDTGRFDVTVICTVNYFKLGDFENKLQYLLNDNTPFYPFFELTTPKKLRKTGNDHIPACVERYSTILDKNNTVAPFLHYTNDKDILVYGSLKNLKLSAIQYDENTPIYHRKHHNNRFFNEVIIFDKKNNVLKFISACHHCFYHHTTN